MEPDKILFVSALPKDREYVWSDPEVREIEEELRLAPDSRRMEIIHLRAASVEDLERAIMRERPVVLHFCGHGTPGGILLEDRQGDQDELTLDDLANLLRTVPEIRLLILTACYTGQGADALLQRAPIIGMRGEIDNVAAIKFIRPVYMRLANGRPLLEAYESGINALERERLPATAIPVLLHLSGIDPAKWYLTFRPPGERARHRLEQLPVPTDADVFVGRHDATGQLEQAWTSSTSIVQLVGDGGIGKSTIVWHWLQSLRTDGYAGVSQAIDWSFYNQNNHAYTADSHAFFEAALAHFRAGGTVFNVTDLNQPETGREVADAFVAAGGIMVLDGVEPLQKFPSEGGGINDVLLQTFLTRLRSAAFPGPGAPQRLLVVTTRWEIPDLAGHDIRTVHVERLDRADGGRLLKSFRLRRDAAQRQLHVPLVSDGDAEEEFRKASDDFSGHPLSLVLLASFLILRHDGDLTRRDRVDKVPPKEEDPYRHARRLMRSYDRFLDQAVEHGRNALFAACRNVLRMLGLFTRPAPLGVLNDLRKEQIAGLTDALPDESAFDEAVSELRQLHLIAPERDAGREVLDTHPIIREHYRTVLNGEPLAHSAKSAHAWLFAYFEKGTGLPTTAREASPIFDAISHGCKAGRHQEAYRLYLQRFFQGNESALGRIPGVVGPLLTAMAHFFRPNDWGEPIGPQPPDIQGLDAGASLRLLQDAALFHTVGRGHGTKEVKQALAGAAKRLGLDTEILPKFQHVYNAWNFSLAKSELDAALASARQLYEISGREGEAVNVGLRVAAHSAEGAALLYLGKLSEACATLQQGCALLQSGDASWGQILYAQDPPVACRGYLAWVYALQGCLDQALAVSEENVLYARRLYRPFSIACALHFASIVRRIRREPQESLTTAEEQMKISQMHAFPLWLAAGAANEGYALIELGRLGEGIPRLVEGVHQWHQAVPGLVRSHWHALLADGYLRSANDETDPAAREMALQQAAQHVREGTEWGETTGEIYFAAELHRAAGILGECKGDPTAALCCYEQARNCAESQGAHLFALRAATAAARLYQRQGDFPRAAAALETTLARVAEGHGCADWREAKALSEEVRGRPCESSPSSLKPNP